jgi:hypothetical protein
MQWFLTRIVGIAGAAFPYELGWAYKDSDGEMSDLGLGDVKDDSVLFTDPEPPEFLHEDNLLFTKGSEYHREEVEGDGVRVGGGEHE